MVRIGLKLTLLVAGLSIMALPDSDSRVLSLSADHGPSREDAVGLLIVLAGYGWLLMDLWRRRERIRRHSNAAWFKISLFVLGLGYGLIIASVLNDYKAWWIYGVGLVVTIHLAVFYFAFKSP